MARGVYAGRWQRDFDDLGSVVAEWCAGGMEHSGFPFLLAFFGLRRQS
jgi:hypothetical protein